VLLYAHLLYSRTQTSQDLGIKRGAWRAEDQPLEIQALQVRDLGPASCILDLERLHSVHLKSVRDQ